MKAKLLTVGLVLALGMSGAANAKGCLKGAAVGGVGGHFLGHHSLAGAAVGCAVGHHRAAKAEKATPVVDKSEWKM